MSKEDLRVTEVKGMRVLTSAQIADCYETTLDCIKQNFHANKARYIEGKHYIALEGKELREFKNKVRNSHSVIVNTENEVRDPHSAADKAKYQFETEFKYAKSLYLWTEKGALLHAKSLNTDKAWEVYDYLVDFYFRVKEGETAPAVNETKPAPVTKPKEKEIPQMGNPMRILKVLLKVAEDKGIKVDSFDFGSVHSMLKGNHIGICTGVTVERACYELAWELAHAFIHYDGGDMIKSPLSKDYNEQASRAAEMVIKILNVKIGQM